MLIVVRHARPDARPDMAPRDWTLSDEGLAAARDLCSRLPEKARLVSSWETKAWQTLGGGTADEPIVQDSRFDEVDRPPEPWSDDVQIRRRAYVTGSEHRGWERQELVASRFQAGVDDNRAEADDVALVVASHGMAITIWLVSIGAVEPDAAGDFWHDLRFPDALVVDVATPSVARHEAAPR